MTIIVGYHKFRNLSSKNCKKSGTKETVQVRFFIDRSRLKEKVEKIRCAMKRSKPYGSEGWVSKAVAQFGLENTVRNRGRPGKGA